MSLLEAVLNMLSSCLILVQRHLIATKESLPDVTNHRCRMHSEMVNSDCPEGYVVS